MTMRVNIEDTEDDYNGVLYEGVPYTGEVVEIGREGNLISLYNYYAGVQDGPYSEWYGPDRPFKQGTMRFGLLIGVNRKWHPNGQLALETEFDDQGRELYRREWDDKGALTYEHVI
jgi:antitoxin component YwqK of YwqJK toxin-antitoxin module